MMKFFLIYVICINIVGYCFMYIDKKRAIKNKYRIRERTLWQIAIVGGAVGATLGMERFRHKTQHKVFKWGLPALSFAEVILIISMWMYL